LPVACKKGRAAATQLAGLAGQSLEKTAACATWYDSCSIEVTYQHRLLSSYLFFQLLMGPHYNAFN
jgi:hypothetical protein